MYKTKESKTNKRVEKGRSACTHVTKLMGDFLCGTLSEAQVAVMNDHLAKCSRCRKVLSVSRLALQSVAAVGLMKLLRSVQ